jgi:hypothetical protein
MVARSPERSASVNPETEQRPNFGRVLIVTNSEDENREIKPILVPSDDPVANYFDDQIQTLRARRDISRTRLRDLELARAPKDEINETRSEFLELSRRFDQLSPTKSQFNLLLVNHDEQGNPTDWKTIAFTEKEAQKLDWYRVFIENPRALAQYQSIKGTFLEDIVTAYFNTRKNYRYIENSLDFNHLMLASQAYQNINRLSEDQQKSISEIIAAIVNTIRTNFN